MTLEKGGRLSFPAISEKTYVKALYDPSLLYVTHLHELTLRITDLVADGHKFRILCAANDKGRRTYRIVPYDGRYTESSLAKDIVIESGLGFLFD